MAVLPLAHVGVPLVNSLADLIRSGAALGHDDSPGGVIAASGGRLVAFGLLVVLAVVLSVVFALAVRVLAVAIFSGAIKLGRGPASPVDDGLLLVLAVRVMDVDADILLLGRGGDVVNSIADTLLDLVSLLDGEADLDSLVLDILSQLADDLLNLEALALLLVGQDGVAVLVGNIRALLLMRGAADAIVVALAVLLVDGVVNRLTDELLAVPIVLRVGVPIIAVRVLLVALVVAVVLVRHRRGEDRERHEAEDPM